MSDRAQRNDEDTTIFINLCLKQVRLGRRASGHLKGITFREIGLSFKEIRGRLLTPKQLRNKWDTLRKQWEKWNWLERYAKLGIRWNGILKTFDASTEWWLAAKEEYKRTYSGSILVFRVQGLKNKESLEEMFRGTKGTNDKLWALSSSCPPPKDSPEGNGDSNGDPRFIDPQDNFTSLADDGDEGSLLPNGMRREESLGKRKPFAANARERGGKPRYFGDNLTNDLGDLIVTLQAKTSDNSMFVCSDNDPRSIKAVMQEVWALSAVVENNQLSLDAVNVLMDPTKQKVLSLVQSLK